MENNVENFFEDVENALKSNNQKNELYLEKGTNILRLLSKPQIAVECFVVTSKEIDDKKTGGKKMLEINEPVYAGCGYEEDGRSVFYTYAISEKDQTHEDGSPKIQLIALNKTVLAGLMEAQSVRVLQGEPAFGAMMNLDTIITKTGEGLSTKYSVSVMLTEKNNKIKFSMEEIKDVLDTLPTVREVLDSRIKDAKERHAKFGKPVSKASLERASKVAEVNNSLPTVQIGDEFEGTVYPSEDINPEDIPF